MSETHVLVEKSGGRAEVTISRPDAMNALNADVMQQLIAAFEELHENGDIRAVILTGAGEKAFVAGADISHMAKLGPDEARAFGVIGHSLGDTLARVRPIVIAAVNGWALGGGCELALACDFIYASEKARFGQPEVKLGVIPGFGGTQRLARRVGMARALEMIVVGEPIGAEEALRIGLVNAVLPAGELMAHARKTADAIAARGPRAVAVAKRVVRLSQEIPLEEGLRTELDCFGECFVSDEQKEGMKAFLEKRPPSFPGL